jgi:hypothetical protein
MELAEMNTDAALQAVATDPYLDFENIGVHLFPYLCSSVVSNNETFQRARSCIQREPPTALAKRRRAGRIDLTQQKLK